MSVKYFISIIILTICLLSNAEVLSTSSALTLQRFRALKATKPAEAETLLLSALKKDKSATLYYELGLFYAEQKKLAKAIAQFKTVMRLNPEFPGAGRNLGILLIQEKRYPEAIQVISSLGKATSLGGNMNLLLAQAYTATGNNLAALQCLKSALPAFPKQLSVRLKIAETLYQLQRFEQAVGAAKDVISSNPTESSAWVICGNAYMKQLKYANAIDSFEAARLLNPTLDATLLTVLGDLYLHIDLPETAAQYYRRAGPKTLKRQLALARALYDDAAYENCRSLVETIRAADQTNATALALAGLTAYKQNRLVDAATLLKSYISNHPLDGEVLVALGDCAARQNHTAAALSWYRSARQAALWKRYAMESELDLHLKNNDTDNARQLLQELTTAFPSPQWGQLLRHLGSRKD